MSEREYGLVVCAFFMRRPFCRVGNPTRSSVRTTLLYVEGEQRRPFDAFGREAAGVREPFAMSEGRRPAST